MTRNNWLMEATAEYAGHKIVFNPAYALSRNVNMDYFAAPLGTTEALLWNRGEHEYRSAQFIEYLVKNHGLDIKGLLEYYSQNYLGHNFTVLDDYLNNKNPEFMLGKAYLDFAGYMMLDTSGDLKDINTYDKFPYKATYTGGYLFENIEIYSDKVYVPKLMAIKIDIPDKEKKTIVINEKITYGNMATNVYLLKNNQKVSGTKPILEVINGSKSSISVEVEKGDVLYILSGNAKLHEAIGKDDAMKANFTLTESDLLLKTKSLTTSRTHRIETLWLEGALIDSLGKNIEYQWKVVSQKGDVVNLLDATVATVNASKLTVTLTHDDPINSWEEKIARGWVSSGSPSSNPFDVIIENIDDGTNYTISVKLIDKITKKELGTAQTVINVGMLTSMKEGNAGDSIRIP